LSGGFFYRPARCSRVIASKHFAVGKILMPGGFISPEQIKSNMGSQRVLPAGMQAAMERWEHLNKLIELYK